MPSKEIYKKIICICTDCEKKIGYGHFTDHSCFKHLKGRKTTHAQHHPHKCRNCETYFPQGTSFSNHICALSTQGNTATSTSSNSSFVSTSTSVDSLSYLMTREDNNNYQSENGFRNDCQTSMHYETDTWNTSHSSTNNDELYCESENQVKISFENNGYYFQGQLFVKPEMTLRLKYCDTNYVDINNWATHWNCSFSENPSNPHWCPLYKEFPIDIHNGFLGGDLFIRFASEFDNTYFCFVMMKIPLQCCPRNNAISASGVFQISAIGYNMWVLRINPQRVATKMNTPQFVFIDGIFPFHSSFRYQVILSNAENGLSQECVIESLESKKIIFKAPRRDYPELNQVNVQEIHSFIFPSDHMQLLYVDNETEETPVEHPIFNHNGPREYAIYRNQDNNSSNPEDNRGGNILPLFGYSPTGSTRTHYLASHGKLEQLHEYFASERDSFEQSLNQQDQIGHTPLHDAVMEGYIDTALFLLDCGSSPQIKDSLGFNALMIVFARYHHQFDRFLNACIQQRQGRLISMEQRNLPPLDSHLSSLTSDGDLDNNSDTSSPLNEKLKELPGNHQPMISELNLDKVQSKKQIYNRNQSCKHYRCICNDCKKTISYTNFRKHKCMRQFTSRINHVQDHSHICDCGVEITARYLFSLSDHCEVCPKCRKYQFEFNEKNLVNISGVNVPRTFIALQIFSWVSGIEDGHDEYHKILTPDVWRGIIEKGNKQYEKFEHANRQNNFLSIIRRSELYRNRLSVKYCSQFHSSEELFPLIKRLQTIGSLTENGGAALVIIKRFQVTVVTYNNDFAVTYPTQQDSFETMSSFIVFHISGRPVGLNGSRGPHVTICADVDTTTTYLDEMFFENTPVIDRSDCLEVHLLTLADTNMCLGKKMRSDTSRMWDESNDDASLNGNLKDKKYFSIEFQDPENPVLTLTEKDLQNMKYY